MPRRAYLYRSTDGGELFTPIELEILEGEETPIVVGVDPTNAERLFVRMPRRMLDREPERLLVSEDGGDTFVTAHTLQQIRGFAISDDGRTVWAGSATGDGVWIARDGTLAFTQINTLHVRCLEARGETLWLCVDQLNSRFALGRSADEGATVDELFYLDEVEDRPECPTCSATGVICPFWVDDLALDFTRYFDAPPGMPVDASIPAECIDAGPPDAGAPTVDAGAPNMDGGVVTPPPTGCGCSAAGGDGGGLFALAFAAVIARLLRRRT
jgi:MYXO-CTERM domain-containing protein